MTREDETGFAETQPGVARRLRAERDSDPPVLGRYLAVRQLGEGGMGVVWLARDPELDRDVAVKVVRRIGRDPADSELRLRREAQALAQLSDPHVVQVFDVGRADGAIWIAMELVDGQSLDAWLKTERRSIAEIVEVFVQAGRGLQAAHEAGLVHRDFKPSNVMIGREGLVRVLDFGLARALEAPVADDEIPAGLVEVVDTLQSRVTRSGVAVGTPAYMAPEQIHARAVDARTDVFAFCVALYEALYGERPYRGDTWPQLAAAILAGRIREPTRAVKMPPALRAIVVRGLMPSAEKRWPDMASLLTVLAPWQRPRRSRVVPAVAVLALGAGAAALLGRTDDPCALDGHTTTARWDDDARGRLHATFATDAGALRDETIARLDAWADDWRSSFAIACEVDTPAARARLACLARIERSFGATIDLLEEGDARVLTRALEVALALPAVARCNRVDDVMLAEIADPALAVEAAEIEAILARSAALEAAGRYGEALAAAREAVVRADEDALAGLRARALLRTGIVEDLTGDYADALADLERAYEAAAIARDDRIAAESALRIARVLADRFDRLAEAERWLHQADAWVRRVDDRELDASFAASTAAWHHAAGDFATARREYERALEMRMALHGEDHPAVHAVANNLGNTLASSGFYDEAIAVHRRTLASRERMYPPNHPMLAFSLNNLANSLVELDRYDEARELYERARDVLVASVGPDSALLLRCYDNLGVVAYQQKRWDEAEASLRQALELRARTLGEDHPDQAKTLMNLGNLAAADGRPAEALEWYARAIALRERDVGEDHPEVAILLHNMAGVHARRRDFAEAVPLLRRAMEIRERTLPADHPHLFGTRVDFALSAIETGDLDEATGVLERTAANVPSTTVSSRRVQVELLQLEVLLGRADGPRALALARSIYERIDGRDEYEPEVRAHTRFGLARALVLTNGASTTTDELGRSALALAPTDTRIHDRIAEWVDANEKTPDR